MRVAFRFSDRRLLARLIAWWQRSDVSHCETIVDGPIDDGDVLCVSSSWVDGGVRVKSMPLPADRWRIYELPGGGPIPPDAWAETHAGSGYDWLGLIGIYLRPATRGSRRRWICSEACAELLGLPEPWRFDVAALEAICRRYGTRRQ